MVKYTGEIHVTGIEGLKSRFVFFRRSDRWDGDSNNVLGAFAEVHM